MWKKYINFAFLKGVYISWDWIWKELKKKKENSSRNSLEEQPWQPLEENYITSREVRIPTWSTFLCKSPQYFLFWLCHVIPMVNDDWFVRLKEKKDYYTKQHNFNNFFWQEFWLAVIIETVSFLFLGED